MDHAPLERAFEALRAARMDAALLASPANVTYCSGWAAPLAHGPIADVLGQLPLAYVLLVPATSSARLIVADAYAASAREANRAGELTTFGSLGHFDPVDGLAELRDALATALRDHGMTASASPRVAIEERAVPAVVRDAVVAVAGPPAGDAAPPLAGARLIKTPEEIERLRRAVRVADAGQRTLLALSRESGSSELELWRAITGAMELEAGAPLTVTGELVTGARTRGLAMPNGPFPGTVEAGDNALLDISPRVDGYWADCTNSVVFAGEASAGLRRLFHAARDSCEAAIERLRPGALARDAAEAVATTMAGYGLPVAHYTGHQLGVTVNELPRLVPYDDTPIEAGMVFAVEPGAYGGDALPFGARAEKVVLVTDDGPELLSDFPWGID